MTLPTLEHVDLATARGLLADAILLGLSNQPSRPIESPRARAVLDDGRRVLGLSSGDRSGEAQEKLAKFFDGLISSYALPPERREAALNRLGERGDLWPSGYVTKINPNALKDGRFTTNQIESVLRSPDAVQHLGPAGDVHSNDLVSLYAKVIERQRKGEPYVSLVDARRTGHTMTAHAAWRLFADAGWRGASVSPLDLFRLFVQRHGVCFRVGASQEIKLFVLYERLERGHVAPQRLVELVGTPDRPLPPGGEVKASMRIRVNAADVEVALAYAINLHSYQHELARQGIV
jgi:hypothetical protein